MLSRAQQREQIRLFQETIKRIEDREIEKRKGKHDPKSWRLLRKKSAKVLTQDGGSWSGDEDGPTKDEVIANRPRDNYVPNPAARSLSLQRTHAIGAIVPTLDYSIFARFVEALQDKALQHGYSILLSTCGFGADFQERELQQARALEEQAVDAGTGQRALRERALAHTDAQISEGDGLA